MQNLKKYLITLVYLALSFYALQADDTLEHKNIDGLNISEKLQKATEYIIKNEKQRLDAKEIVAVVMKSETGEILALASSNRSDLDLITNKDFKWLSPTIAEYIYEPGSVMKPVVLSILLRENKVAPNDLVNVHSGSYKFGRRIIRDNLDFKYLSAEDIIVYSSNIGILQLAQKLSSTEYHQGLQDFGFSKKTNIDLPNELSGNIPSINRFKSKIYKGTVGYGYGLKATFMQMLKAYNLFNNSGKFATPKITKSSTVKEKSIQVLPTSIANEMKKILIKTVQKGTGKKAITKGVKIGGKTGTAHIAINGKYENKYNGSFMGFANDEKHQYTIGVLTREPKKKNSYIGAKSAVPSFKKIVDVMVEMGYLVPKNDTNITK